MESRVIQLSGNGPVEPLPRRPGRAPSAAAPAAPGLPGAERGGEEAHFLVRQAAAAAAPPNRQTFARFVVDPETHDVSVHIVDANSQEVIRTIPNEDLRQMAQSYRAAAGLFLDSAV